MTYSSMSDTQRLATSVPTAATTGQHSRLLGLSVAFHMPFLIVALRSLSILFALLEPVVYDAQAETKSGPDVGQETSTQDIKAGQQYGSGIRVRAPTLGASFVIPKDWLGGMPPGSQAFLLGSNTKAGLGLAVMFHAVTPQEVADQLNEPQALEEGFVLHPVGSAKRVGNRMTASYHAGEHVGRAVAVLGPEQNAIVYLFTGPKDQGAYYDALIEEIAASTQFTKVDSADVLNRWRELLTGMTLKRLEQYSSGVGGGYNMSTAWHLCRDGRFTYTHSSHITIQVPGGGTSNADQDHRQGTWRVEVKGADALLVLTEDNGAVRSHALAYDGEKTFLDKERVFRVESEGCP